MRPFQSLLIAAAMSLPLPCWSQAVANAVFPNLTEMVYRPATLPVFISSWTMGQNDLLQDIQLQNPGDKEVRSIQLQWIAATPAACTVNDTAPPVLSGVLPPRYVYLQPHRSMHAADLGLPVEQLLQAGRQQGSLFLDVQVVPIRVVYADGSVWSRPEWKGQNYDPGSTRLAGIQNCAGGHLLPVMGQPRNAAARQVPPLIPNAPCALDGDCTGHIAPPGQKLYQLPQDNGAE